MSTELPARGGTTAGRRRLTTWPHSIYTRVDDDTWAEVKTEAEGTGQSPYHVVRGIMEEWASRRLTSRESGATPGPVAGRKPVPGREHPIPTRVSDATWDEMATTGKDAGVVLCMVVSRWAASRRAHRQRRGAGAAQDVG